MKRILDYKKYIILITCILLLLGFIGYYVFVSKEEVDDIVLKDDISVVSTSEVINNNIFVDVKGAVKKPGVYELTSDDKVIDAINVAGGLASNAVTYNINLSKKLTNEMVIYVFTKKELTTTSVTIKSDTECKCEVVEVNNCVKSDEEDKSKVNINNAGKDELTSLNGIGDAKAEAIIAYRNENGLFKSIEDILNVSGISSNLYEKIKDSITV